MKRKLTIFFLVLIPIILIAVTVRYLPTRYNPLQPLALDDAPTFITAFKLRRLRNNPEQCFAVLNRSENDYTRLEDRETGENCGFFNAARLQQSGVSYGGDITLKCPALVGLLLWEQHHLQPLANKLLDTDVVRVSHFGTYSCRNVNNRTGARQSQHATANAIDIAGFTLRDGRQINVLDDWNTETDKSRFLRELHHGACEYFSSVLGPDYNSLHANHFHFDMGRFGVCR